MTPVTSRPSAIVGDRLILDRHGAAIVLAALELAITQANRAGARYRGRDRYSDFQWVYEQARLIASGTAAGTPGTPFRVAMPSSAPMPELLTTRQAAKILGVSARAVTKQISAGQLPARRVGREWVVTEYDVRHAARNGRRPDASPERAT